MTFIDKENLYTYSGFIMEGQHFRYKIVKDSLIKINDKGGSFSTYFHIISSTKFEEHVYLPHLPTQLNPYIFIYEKKL